MKKMRKLFLIYLCVVLFVSIGFGEELADKVIITGDTMELKDHGNITLFKGGVKLVHGNSILLGETMRYDKIKSRIDINGNVLLRFRGEEAETILAKAQEAVYFEQEGKGHMWGNAEIIRTGKDETGQVNLYAKDLYFDETKEEVRASGDVHIIQSDTEARSDEALLKYPEHTVILTGGNPVFFRRDTESMGEYRGDTIIIKYKQKRIILDKSVRGWIRLAEKPEQDKEKADTPTIKTLREKKSHAE